LDRVGADVGLQNLAEARAAGVRAFLITEGKMAAGRLVLESGESDRTPGKGGEIANRVLFKVVVDN
jgi:hypothetical protein